MEQFLWTEKYRPKTIADTILSDSLKKVFQEFVDQKNIPNLTLIGESGIGKTTVARALCEEIDCDYIVINGSLKGNIDTLRTEITDFASSVSFHGGRKYVILDEADYLNPNSTQPALRNFMEEFSKNCGFILTANFPKKIIEPLHSRTSVINFSISKQDLPKLAGLFFKRIQNILTTENIEFDKKVLVEVIQKYFPDWRRIINEIQTYSSTGKIDTGILVNFADVDLKELMGLLKEKKFTDIRKWIGEHLENPDSFFRSFYDHSSSYFKKNFIPLMVILLAKYQYQSAFVVDQEINTVAFLTEVMVDAEWL